MSWQLLIGFAWAMVGLHVLDWAAERAGQHLDLFAGSRHGWIFGWVFVALWPLVIAAVFAFRGSDADEC